MADAKRGSKTKAAASAKVRVRKIPEALRPMLVRPPLRPPPLLSAAQELKRDQRLLLKVKRRLPALKKLLRETRGLRAHEDAVYRFYHQSFKVYMLQDLTIRIVEALQDLAPGAPINQAFREILVEGTNKKWDTAHNRRWSYETRPILEAFFHARYFLQMACRHGQGLKRAPSTMPSGWAALLYFFDWR